MSADYQLFLFSMGLATCGVAVIKLVYDVLTAKGTDQLGYAILAVLALGLGFYLILHNLRGIVHG